MKFYESKSIDTGLPFWWTQRSKKTTRFYQIDKLSNGRFLLHNGIKFEGVKFDSLQEAMDAANKQEKETVA